MSSIPGSGRLPWRRAWQPTSVFLPGKSHGQRSLVGYCPQGHEGLHMTVVAERSTVFHRVSVCVTDTHPHCIFFIHSSVAGHLGYFHVLAIGNSAAMYTEVHVSF